jgi:multiple sugar transport system permease protein
VSRAGQRGTIALIVGIPLAIQVALVWLPAAATAGLSLTDWNGVGGLDALHFVGLDNYRQLATIDPAFWPALLHNLVWLIAFLVVAMPLGMLLAVLLDRELRGGWFYESAIYLPVVLSMAVIGLIWELQYRPEDGLINGLLGTNRQENLIDWLGDRSLNLGAVIVAAAWRHVGYVMLLYLAGLKGVDRVLREAAEIDGASEAQAFRRVVFPVLHTVNVVVVVVTAIEALRAFDIVYVINHGLNGLELLAVIVVNNILGGASRIGYGSAAATLLLLFTAVPIALFIRRVMGRDRG